MNILKTLLIVLVLNSGFSMPANAAFLDGNEYRQAPESLKMGYLTGIVDAIEGLSEWGFLTEAEIVNMNTCTKDMTPNQVVAIVDKYLENNPEIWHLTMASHVINALIEACGK
jgi:hypothetical protein